MHKGLAKSIFLYIRLFIIRTVLTHMGEESQNFFKILYIPAICKAP